MRILIASWHQAILGGTETYLRDIVPALRERGHEVAILFENLAPPAQAHIDDDSRTPAWQLTRQTQECVLSEAAAWRPDVCFLHPLEDVAHQAALAARFPTVFFAHNYHGTCISGNKRFAFPSERPCQKTFGPACLLHYFARSCGGRNPLTMIQHYAQQRKRLALLPQYRAIVVASRALRDEYRRHGIAAERIHCVPLFPTGSAHVAAPAPRQRSGMVLFIGRLTDIKGCHLAIDAVHAASALLASPLELVVAGDGPERSRLENQARRLGARVRFVGWVDRAERDALLEEADALIVPSVWPEPFGLVGLEAACHGLPAVGFAVGGIPDWLEPGVSGESAGGESLTAESLAHALTRLLRVSEYWHRLRRGAWESARTFSRAAHVARLESILRQYVPETAPCNAPLAETLL